MCINITSSTLHKINKLPFQEAVELIYRSLLKQGVSPVSARRMSEKIIKKVKANRRG